jgi:hypothetical protein
MNAAPDYSYHGKSRTIVLKFSNAKYTNDTFSIVCKDQVSKDILIEKLKSVNPTEFDTNREYFFVVNKNSVLQCTWRKHQTRIELILEFDFSGCGGGCGTSFVDNVFPLDLNASTLIENDHILYVLDKTLLKFLQSKI